MSDSAGVWTEHRNAEGRTYWFNTNSKESVWEKPDVLKTPFERALVKTDWKEYVSGGRKYYYNTVTKESKWTMPDELVELQQNLEREASAATSGRLIAPAGAGLPANPLTGQQPDLSLMSSQQAAAAALAVGRPNNGLPVRPNMPEDPVVPHNGFATQEDAEKAFWHLLRKVGVDASWTWENTLRSIVTDPLYKAFNSLAERRSSWDRFVSHLNAKETEEKEARLSKLRPAIRNMLKGNPNVFHYTTFATADRLFTSHPIWQQARIEAERRMLFEEHVAELKDKEMVAARELRVRNMEKVVQLFKQLGMDVLTRWNQAVRQLKTSDEWNNDPQLQKLPELDILLAFEDYSRVQEREYEDAKNKAGMEKRKKERKAREGFKDLLTELRAAGHIKAQTKWKEVYPLLHTDERYEAMLGNPGSNPLEMFWDVVDELDQVLDEKIDRAEAVLKNTAPSFSVGVNTPESEFRDALGPEHGLEDGDVVAVFQYMRDRAIKRQEDEKRRAERRIRHATDDLRYALKKTNIEPHHSYDDAVPLMAELPEYVALADNDEARRSAFAKFIKRQKEKLRERERDGGSDDGGSTTSRKRKEPNGHAREEDRDRERDRDRDRDRDRERERDRDRDRNRYYDDRDHHGRRDRDGYGGRDRYRDDRGSSSKPVRHDRDRERDRDRGGDRERRSSDAAEPYNGSSGSRARTANTKRERDDDDTDRGRDDKRPRTDAETARQPGADSPEEGEI